MGSSIGNRLRNPASAKGEAFGGAVSAASSSDGSMPQPCKPNVRSGVVSTTGAVVIVGAAVSVLLGTLRLGSIMRKSVELDCPSQIKSSANRSRLATKLLVLLSSKVVIIESAGVRMSIEVASSAPPCLGSCRRPGRCSYTHSMPRRRHRVHDGCELVHFVLAALQARHDGARTRGRSCVWRQYSRCRFLDDS